MLNYPYNNPSIKLLSYGECVGSGPENWPNYAQALGLTVEDIPDLIHMAEDEQLWRFFFTDPTNPNADEEDLSEITPIQDNPIDPEVALWAPIHAWRALGQLQAAESVKPLAHVLANRREAPRSPEGERRDESQGH